MDQLLEEVLIRQNDNLHTEISKLLATLSTDIKQEVKVANPIRANAIQTAASQISLYIQDFEPSPKLLDKHLLTYISQLSGLYLEVRASSLTDTRNPTNRRATSAVSACAIADVVYAFSKIRGFKIITNYFSSDVYLVPKLLQLKECSDLSDNENFLILLWLSNLVLVPFELATVQHDLPDRLYDVSLTNLTKYSNGSKNQVVSSILLSRLLTRSDQGILLDKYLREVEYIWSIKHSQNHTNKLGHLITVNKVMKRCPNFEQYSPIIEEILQVDYKVLGAVDSSSKVASDFTNLNVLYIIKLSDRLCQLHLKKSAKGRKYVFIETVINALFSKILSPLETRFDTNLRYAFARALSNICAGMSDSAINYQDQLIEFIFGEFDIPNLDIETAYSHTPTFQKDLIINFDYISIPKYHTLILTLGYLALKKCIPIRFLPMVVGIVHKTLFFTQKKLTVTIGSQIRDSSCFVLWAIFRNLTTEEFARLINKEIRDLILIDILRVCIFDKDLVIRRCGIAILQEYVGRFGSSVIQREGSDEERGKLIIEFIQLFDSQSVATSAVSYQLILRLVDIGFSRDVFIHHLLKNINDDDNTSEIKKLSTNILVSLFKENAHSPNQSTVQVGQDSARLSYGEVQDLLKNSLDEGETGPLYAFGKLLEVQEVISDTTKEQISFALDYLISSFSFDYHFDTHDRGEEFCSFITSIIKNGYVIQEKVQKELDLHLFEILRLSHRASTVQVFQEYFATQGDDLSPIWFKTLLQYIRSDNFNASEAISHISNLTPSELKEVIEKIQDKSIQAETRALLQKSLGFYYHNHPETTIEIPSLLLSLDDYTTTNQGDVGSKLRRNTVLLVQDNLTQLKKRSYQVIEEITSRLIRLATEPLKHLRILSLSVLNELSQTSELVSDFSDREFYTYLLNSKYHHLLNDEHKLAFWSGYIFSTGGASSRSTMNDSVSAFIEYVETYPREIPDVLNYLLKLLVPSVAVTSSSADPGKVFKAIPQRVLKRYSATINLITIMFEANLIETDPQLFEKIYIRCYNLHINTKSIERVGLVLKVFVHLATNQSAIASKAQTRLRWISCHHPISAVRIQAGEGLFEVANATNNTEICNYLVDIHWDVPLAELKPVFKRLEAFTW